MKTWIDPAPIEISPDLRAAVGGHPLVAAALARRGIALPALARRFLDPASYTPASPGDLPDMARAVERLHQAIRRREHILVWGDFDVDGQTSTALLVSALHALGGVVSHYIPQRLTEGHGIALPRLKTLLDGGVAVLLTCDTGIAAHAAVDHARSRGVAVVITDHHSLPDALPAADAVVNPMRLPPGHPLRELPGVGTAYKLVEALYDGRSTDHLLDLVAVGIVADVMVQVDDTRYLLQRGLDVLRQAERPAIRALLERAEIDPAYLTETDIGFALAPRLNALGRLADANPAVELLTTSDPAVLTERINELEGLNQKRRFLTRQVYAAAQEQIQRDPSLLKYAALVIAGAGWHTGVVGIVASRLADEYGCPVVVLSDNDGVVSGSARSVAGCNIVDAIRSQAHLLTGYGGHAMAAGLSLPTDKLFEFRRGLSQVVRDALGTSAVAPQLALDGYVDLAEIDLDFAEDIARLAPFGNGNPPLALATRTLRVKSRRTLGSRGDHVELRVVDEAGNEQRVLWWFGEIEDVPEGRFDLAYTVRANVYNDRREALIEWLDARPSDDQAVSVAGEPGYAVVDLRGHPDPRGALAEIMRDHADVLVWREAFKDIDGADRLHLRPAQTLVIWSAPPSPLIWRSVLETVQPATLVLFGSAALFDQPEALLQQVAGLLKYAARHKGGEVNLSDIAALTGQTEQTIRACFAWCAAHTALRLTPLVDDVYQVVMAEDTASERSGDATRLARLLAETRAYRRYWLRQSFGRS